MLNEKKDCADSTEGYEGNDIYSLVSDANWSEADEDIAELVVELDDADDAANLGLLILDGEDYDGGGDEEGTVNDDEAEEEKRQDSESVSLSIPETLFLPSEVRTIEASGVTNEQDKHNRAESTGNIQTTAGSDQPPIAICLRAGRFGTVKSVHALLIVLTSFIFLAFQSWRVQVWRNEALRLGNELKIQNSLLPLTLSLAKERMALMETQAQLEETIERLKRRTGSSSNEEIITPDQSEADRFLSIKTCYVDASLSLGPCAKDWQDWWYNTPDGSNSQDTRDELYDDEDEFTTDLTKLAMSLTTSLAATTKESYSFVEKTVKESSYDGIKDAQYKDIYNSRFGQAAPDVENNTGDTSCGCAGGFGKILSKLINSSDDAADEVTSKLSLWNW